jgi:hypothetical protein
VRITTGGPRRFIDEAQHAQPEGPTQIRVLPCDPGFEPPRASIVSTGDDRGRAR